MKIGLFIFASIIYILIISAFVFQLNLGYYNLSFFSYSLELPITLWIIIPILIFFIFALMHISFYNFLKNLKFRHFIKDFDKFQNYTSDLLLEKKSKISFYTKEFKDVSQLALILKDKKNNENFPKINEILLAIDEIKNGKYIDIKKFKLDKENEIYIQNEKNHISNDIDYAFSKIKHLHSLSNDTEKLAFDVLIQKGDYEKIKNLKIKKSKEDILKIIKRFENNDLNLNSAEFEVLLSMDNLEEKEYLDIAKNTSAKFNPDIIINIFKKLKNEKEQALRAYLYLLANFSIYDELLDQIRNNEEHKFDDFYLILFLRDNNKKIDLDCLIK